MFKSSYSCASFSRFYMTLKPDLDPVYDDHFSGDDREVQEEMSVIFDKDDVNMFTTLNTEQRAGFDEILSHVVNNRSQIFFVDGPGGTGKTYLYKALLAKVRSLGKIAIATATSGIAASIMLVDVLPTPGSKFQLGSRTQHVQFHQGRWYRKAAQKSILDNLGRSCHDEASNSGDTS